MAIVMAHVPEMLDYDGSAYWAQYFYWDSGNSGYLPNLNGNAGSWPSANGWQSFRPSRYFGWELVCNAGSACNSSDGWLDVADLQLEANEYQTPTITPGPSSGSKNLWSHRDEWVRGTFPIDIEAADPSGVCRVVVSWNGQNVQDTGERSTDNGHWDQCDPNHVSNSPQDFFTGATINTATDVPTSATGIKLELMAHNASYNPSTGVPDWTDNVAYVNVDNTPVTLSLTSDTHDAALSAGTQYVKATASAGPSGIGSIMCSVDGSSWTHERLSGAGTEMATANVGVSGLGSHKVRCYATNESHDASDAPAASSFQTWSLKIGEPVNAGITFAKVVRSCRQIRSGKHRLRCHTTTPQRRVAHLAHGQRTTLRGWFATADGAPLGRVRVRIVAAPDNGLRKWRKLTVVRTAANGSWRTTLPAGPSRLIEAVYDGGPMTERASSPLARVLVAASSTLSFSPVVHFGQLAQFDGRLLGGYVPHTGAIVVVQALDRGHWRNIATVRSDRNGNWHARYAISGGSGNYPVRVRIPHQADYPWAAAVTSAQTLVVKP